MKKFHTVIIGAGPGGLACATKLAENGVNVLVIERNKTVGPKICAGGVTWSGLSQLLPEDLIEKHFKDQYIQTNWQHVKISADDPIICTVDRKKLGQWMLDKAIKAGVTIQAGIAVTQIEKDCVRTQKERIDYTILVGADGSSSIVRRFLNIPSEKLGVGINCIINKHMNRMEWHLLPNLFNTGYAWIFPHKNTASIGAYVNRKDMPAKILLHNFHLWAKKQDIDVEEHKTQAAVINFDFRGTQFDNIFLVGDAAGLASGLTGEGIYPAIVSGEAVASSILDNKQCDAKLTRLINKHKIHTGILELAGKSGLGCKLITESLVFAFRTNMIKFNALEMGDN